MASFRSPQQNTKSVRWDISGSHVRTLDLSKRRSYSEQAEEEFKPSTELFCSKCLAKSMVQEAFGFCKICADFLCKQCVEKHESTLLTLNHGVITGDDMLTRYLRAMKESKKKGKSEGRSQIDMVAEGLASLEYSDNTSCEPENTDDYDNDAVEAELKSELKIKAVSDRRKCFICAIVVYDDGKVVVADANNKNLKLFSKTFTCLFVFNLKQEPWDACRALDFDNDLFVTEAKINGVHQFKVGKEIKYVFTLKTEGECFGLTHWKGGVAVSVKKNKQFSVKLLDQFGNINHQLSDGFDGRLRMKSPWYLASINHGQNILISDSGTGTVTCIDVDMGVKFVFRNKKELSDPRNLAADKEGNIYVVDYETDTVHQLTSAGLDLGVILCGLNGLQNPGGLTCHKQQLYIQTKINSNVIKLFDLVEL